MKLFLAFVRIAFRGKSIYKLDSWAKILSSFVMMYGGYSLWLALYQQHPDAFGVSIKQMTTYGVLGMLLPRIIGISIYVTRQITQQVRMGTLELDMIKPINFILLAFYRNVGEFIVQLLFQGTPGVIFAYLFLEFHLPSSLFAAIVFLISLSLGYVTFFAINLLMGILTVVTLDVRSYSWVLGAVISFASGEFVPLWIFPSSIAVVLAILPFQAIYFSPIAIYIGTEQNNLIRVLLLQFGWCIGLLSLAAIAWRGILKRITIQGG